MKIWHCSTPKVVLFWSAFIYFTTIDFDSKLNFHVSVCLSVCLAGCLSVCLSWSIFGDGKQMWWFSLRIFQDVHGVFCPRIAKEMPSNSPIDPRLSRPQTARGEVVAGASRCFDHGTVDETLKESSKFILRSTGCPSLRLLTHVRYQPFWLITSDYYISPCKLRMYGQNNCKQSSHWHRRVSSFLPEQDPSKSFQIYVSEISWNIVFIGEAPLFVALSDPFRNGHCSRLTFGHAGQLQAKLLHLSAGFGSFISRGKGFHPEKL